MSKIHIVILGAGPAGLGAATKLARTRPVQVTVLERNQAVGGNAGSFDLDGVYVDYGSHRLHPACDPEVFADIQNMLGDDLRERPRHGRIRLRGRWIHFPLKPHDLALRLPPAFALGVFSDMFARVLQGNGRVKGEENFATVLERGLGQTICRDFYSPYAHKIWGMAPDQLSAIQAHRRVSNNSLDKMARKVLSAVPGFKPKGSGIFYYPRKGYGQISSAYHEAALQAGANVRLGARVTGVQVKGRAGAPNRILVRYEQNGESADIPADLVWSTIPITVLARLLDPEPPMELLEATGRIDYRAMILVYLVLKQRRFSEYDAHYFPETEIAITRLSEPKNYSGISEPADRTVLCAELPCSPDDPVWNMSEAQLGDLVRESLAKAGIPVEAPVQRVAVRRLRQAYPIYQQGYEQFFTPLDEWVDRIDGLLSFGRQGLFAHDNTHHALYMAYSAVDCLDENGKFDRQRWAGYRRIFETHVVED